MAESRAKINICWPTKAVILLLCIHCLCFCVLGWSLICGEVLRVLFSSAIILMSKRELVVRFINCVVAVCVLGLPYVPVGWSAACDCGICMLILTFFLSLNIL